MKSWLVRLILNAKLRFRLKLFAFIAITFYLIWNYSQIPVELELKDRSDDVFHLDQQIARLNNIMVLSNMHKSEKEPSYDKLEEFKLNHLKILKGELRPKVVFNGYTEAGYANKVYSMLSSMVMAILTDSA